MKLGLVTYHKKPQLTTDDQRLIPLFQNESITAEPVIWNNPNVNWSSYDALILRSVWDYHLHHSAFLRWLDMLDELSIPLLNPTAIIRENHHKFYLRKCKEEGFAIVPTLFLERGQNIDLKDLAKRHWSKAVIKPAISASSFLTQAFSISEIPKIEEKYQDVIQTRDLLIQKFMPEVQTQGEYSIIFFNREYSHTVLKVARKNEFRVQSEYGGSSTLIEPGPDIIQQAEAILSLYDRDILQSRIDGVVRNGKFILMEIELIEPDLFFNLHEEAIGKYVSEACSIFRRLT